MSLFTAIFGDPNQKYIKKLEPVVSQIKQLGPKYEAMSAAELKNLAADWRAELAQGKTPDDLLPEVFAAAREAAKRRMGSGHFDVQMIGAYVLHQGKIAEMKTGEGKTSYAVSPAAALNALAGQGVHIVTVNDYLSKRDASWIGGVYDALGLTVGVIIHEAAYIYDPEYNHAETGNWKLETKNNRQEAINNKQELESQNPKSETCPRPRSGIQNKFKIQNSNSESLDNETIKQSNNETMQQYLRPVTRSEAYQCDITYGTNNEFGFDYLRDNMTPDLNERVQRGHYYVIIDEIDSILIDEARTPLIISSPGMEATSKYQKFASLILRLKEGEDYNIDEKMRAASLTEEGIRKMEEWLGVENIYTDQGISEVHHIEQALKAQTLFQRDRDYVVKSSSAREGEPTRGGGGEIIIVDEFTGRLMYGRRYSEGLHQAIEAKEGVEIKQESVTMATITFQNYFRMYQKLAGMTGTAATEAEEFSKIYNLDVMVIPTNKPVKRLDRGDLIYKNEAAKFEAVIKDIKDRNKTGQPALVGTISIEKNEIFSRLLNQNGIKHNILNAKNHAKEAAIIAEAGRIGAVTLATNMAGRGVDIVLGGEGASAEDRNKVIEAGGLYVIGTERHESRRIDNQLRGRGGRQGDPGESRFYVSLDDDLMRIFGSDRIGSIMNRLGLPDDMPIEHSMISKSLEAAQKKVEGHHFDMRKHLVEYDDIINKHREVIYRRRDQILGIYESLKNPKFEIQDKSSGVGAGLAPARNDVAPAQNRATARVAPTPAQNNIAPTPAQNDLKEIILDMIENEIDQVVSFHTSADDETQWDIDEIYEVADTIFPLPLAVRLKMDDIQKTAGDKVADIQARNKLINYLIGLAHQAYQELEDRINNVGAGLAPAQNNVAPAQSIGRPQELGQPQGLPLPAMRMIEKMILLRSIDMLWVEHIDAMDRLRAGIGLRGYAQRDPLVEYKREAYQMFVVLQNNIQKQVAYSIFKVGAPMDKTQNSINKTESWNYSGAAKDGEEIEKLRSKAIAGRTSNTMPARVGSISSSFIKSAPVSAQKVKIGRNDPCPCGSGKKYKKCCGK